MDYIRPRFFSWFITSVPGFSRNYVPDIGATGGSLCPASPGITCEIYAATIFVYV